ncbi:soluble angiotensin II-binding protein-like protein [Syncephalis pseudoplumigaleata]|uniref:Soluble angiotensin II-binding protein-like protein n=1 Tax=Syncephalis pseudoplumigaleata TaxID=1712513 RepID=A0A4V1J1Z5_9FUNG|nr:soluble angiotensin II-binding protein-like protein [Syncephalis pseudoplumigaleata]|eukprot:RKP26779.1 soluble angiotensin II-binding protein-like protein [Syncephalis pseudoplumigaleata]
MTIATTTKEGLVNFQLTSAQVKELGNTLIEHSRKVYDTVAAVSDADSNFHTVIRPLAELENWSSAEENVVTFLQYVSADKALRDASMEVDKQLQEFAIESGMRVDLYRRVQAARANTPADVSDLSDEDRRLFDKIELDFKRNGLALPEAERETLKAIKKELADLSIDFSRRINEDVTSIAIDEADLDGMPRDWIDGLAKNEAGQRIVTMKYPDFFPLMKLCKVEETRKKVLFTNETRCKDNIATLEKLLGYDNHAAFKLEVKMAKKVPAVTSFLDDLRKRLYVLAEKELEVLRDVKKREKESLGQAYDGQINAWDFSYYARILKEEKYNVNDELVKEYFSMPSVTAGMLRIYETVLGLKFKEIEKPPVWHSDVRMFEVTDAASNEVIGHFYLDLHPRDGKYTHAACFGLRPGCENKHGQRTLPAAAMVANFSKPTADKPSLLKHDEVTTFFHELGHVMHQICSKVYWSRFHGTAVERDFVEAPSQMLENWCWDAATLEKLSAHYIRKDEPLPKELIQKMVEAKNLNAGLLNLRQIFFGTFDMTLHSSEETLDTTALWAKLREEVTLIKNMPDTWGASTFGHIMGGYDAGYYGYLWSEVFSADMFFSRFEKEGVENPKTGMDYRMHILQPGGSIDGGDMLHNFLGRAPTMDAFLRSIGL